MEVSPHNLYTGDPGRVGKEHVKRKRTGETENFLDAVNQSEAILDKVECIKNFLPEGESPKNLKVATMLQYLGFLKTKTPKVLETINYLIQIEDPEIKKKSEWICFFDKVDILPNVNGNNRPQEPF